MPVCFICVPPVDFPSECEAGPDQPSLPATWARSGVPETTVGNIHHAHTAHDMGFKLWNITTRKLGL